MKKNLMILLAAAMFCACNNANSQTEKTDTPETATDSIVDDCDHEGEDCTCGEGDDFIPVKFSGQQPNILDFVHAYLSIEGMGEGYGDFREAIEAYDKGRKPEHGELIVDIQNGYVGYTVDWNKIDPETDLISTNEMCYWNCKDGRHKIFASNLKCRDSKRYIDTEVTGISYLCYDSETKTMEWNSADQLGALLLPDDMAWPVQDYENSNLGSEYYRYMPVYSLPRVGKSIKVDIGDSSIPASKHRTCELVWNGEGFTKKFSK